MVNITVCGNPFRNWGLVRPICVLKSHVSAPFFFATIQCLTQKQVDNNIYIHKTHTFFFFGVGRNIIYIYIYIHQIHTIYLYPSTSSKLSNGTSSRQTAQRAPPIGVGGQYCVGCVAFAGDSGSRCPGPERREMGWIFLFFGVGGWEKQSFTTSPKKRAKGTLSIGICQKG